VLRNLCLQVKILNSALATKFVISNDGGADFYNKKTEALGIPDNVMEEHMVFS